MGMGGVGQDRGPAGKMHPGGLIWGSKGPREGGVGPPG